MSLTPERFAQVQALWEAAVEQPPEERAAYLLREAPDDPALRQEVARLLVAHDSTGRIFDQPLVRRLGLPGMPSHPPLAGRMLGAYRVVREIGEGGMGTVYEAVRADDQFTKRVAIKTLRAGTDSASMLRRFQRERQIQAALAHPNIATLLDAGVTADGIPYIVLEYIDGLPIDAFCEQHRLGLPARLDLFRQVTQAVQHAHRQLVVHRDLKPTNILVTPDGGVKLLDFGISKLLSESTEQTVTEGARAFTTAYASPEQILGAPISTATDVYSLGVVLYRILTGRVPFEVDSSAPTAVWTRICEEAPAPPSSVATAEAAAATDLGTPERLGRALRGELDAIALMALRKEPDRRYPTADAMGEDILHYLRGLPVLARPDSAGYRIRKLLVRNRLAAAALGLAVLAMVGGTAASLWQARVARASAAAALAERAVADQERRTAQRVSEFLQAMVASADPSWRGASTGLNTTIAEAVDAAADRIDADLSAEPEVAEELHRIVSSAYLGMARFDRGKTHARRVLELREARGAGPAAIGSALHDLSAFLYQSGQVDSALLVARASYARFEEAGLPRTADLVFTLNQLGLALWQAGSPREAEPYLARALTLRRELLGEDAVSAIAHSNLALVRDALGDLAGAERELRASYAILSGLRDREYYERGVTLSNLGMILTMKGETAEAEPVLREAIAVYGRTVGTDHPYVGLTQLTLSRLQLANGRIAEAVGTQEEAELRFRPLPEGHQYKVRSQLNRVAIYLAQGRPAAGEPLARQALANRLATYPPGDWRVAEAEGVLGRVLAARGNMAEAQTLLTRSHQSFQAVMGPEHPRTQEVARALVAMGAPSP